MNNKQKTNCSSFTKVLALGAVIVGGIAFSQSVLANSDSASVVDAAQDQTELDLAKLEEKKVEAELKKAEAELKKAEAELATAEARKAQAIAELEKSKVEQKKLEAAAKQEAERTKAEIARTDNRTKQVAKVESKIADAKRSQQSYLEHGSFSGGSITKYANGDLEYRIFPSGAGCSVSGTVNVPMSVSQVTSTDYRTAKVSGASTTITAGFDCDQSQLVFAGASATALRGLLEGNKALKFVCKKCGKGETTWMRHTYIMPDDGSTREVESKLNARINSENLKLSSELEQAKSL
ncbi:hypothetical protein JCM19231_2603 [Vibrio ishigakensis]|uniref:Uncharacterized protein n=1 Tax=Vibrio ishigakensis TaxID=1481914 RepID=A0A0B8P6Y8_9VIBR|nr:hypothetical protein [Vibrio ishigakensis]GAM58973.1 hypothetical protein JCM19231_2603 [Vibrio ishigakensis]